METVNELVKTGLPMNVSYKSLMEGMVRPQPKPAWATMYPGSAKESKKMLEIPPYASVPKTLENSALS
jgi:hypothetical protein